MIKTLYVNGCSWTEGHLLEEETHVLDYATSLGYKLIPGIKQATKNDIPVPYPLFEIYNEFNWAGQVAKNLGIDNIVNQAEGGGSNPRIVRTTMEYVRALTEEQKKETLVVIGWSLPDRNELYLDDKHSSRAWVIFNAAQEFKFITPTSMFEKEFYNRMSKFWESYVVDVHSAYACIYNFFQQSELLANFLENQGIKYYFFNTFPIFWGTHDVELTKLEELQKLATYYNNRYSVLPTTDTFAEFVGHDAELKLSDGHPNSLAYRLWAHWITEHMKTKGIA